MDVGAVFILLLLIGFTLFASEKLAKAGVLPLVLARKMVHVVAVSAVAISPVFFPNLWLLACIILVFIVVLFWAVAAGKLSIDEQRHRKSWGIALFPISFLSLLLLFGQSHPWLVVYPMLVLALADAAAAIVGETWARHFYQLTGDRKSLLGSFAFFICTFCVLYFFPGWLQGIHPLFTWPALWPSGSIGLPLVLMIALLSAVAESLGSGGADNLTVPIMVAWAMQAASLPGAQVLLFQALAAVLIFVLLVRYKHWLNWSGTITAAWLGMVVWIVANWVLAIPMLVFFMSGSLLGRLPRMAQHDPKHALPRDWMQVLANGGVAGALLMAHTFYPSPVLIICCWASVAIATADTWSSEIGQWAGGKVVDIVSWRPIKPGISGGISWVGSLGGLVGAILIGVLGHWLAHFTWVQTYLIITVGFLGMLADSLLGSTLQAKYALPSGQLTENVAIAAKSKPESGYKWMTNDVVNLASNILLIILLLAVLIIF